MLNKLLEKLSKSGQNPGRDPAPTKTKGGGGKGGGKVKKAAPKEKGHASLKSKIHNLAMRAKKCIKWNKEGCTDKKCQWPHECAICGKTTCAAWKHGDDLE